MHASVRTRNCLHSRTSVKQHDIRFATANNLYQIWWGIMQGVLQIHSPQPEHDSRLSIAIPSLQVAHHTDQIFRHKFTFVSSSEYRYTTSSHTQQAERHMQ